MESHKETFDELKRATQSVLDIVDKHHKPILESWRDDMTEWFNKLRLKARSYVVQSEVQSWLEDKESQLGNISGVIIVQSVHVSSLPCVYT